MKTDVELKVLSISSAFFIASLLNMAEIRKIYGLFLKYCDTVNTVSQYFKNKP